MNRKAISAHRALVPLCVACLSIPAAAENFQGRTNGFTTRQMNLTQAGAPLLQSFFFRFTSADHHFGGMQVTPNIPAVNNVRIGFVDKNHDDQYDYNVTLAPYFGQIFRRIHDPEFCNNRIGCTFPIQRPPDPANHVFVIRGFFISYRGGDHHIKQIRIEENNGMVTVALRDQNVDDHIRIDLHYAYIPRARFSALDQRSGTASGGQQVAIQAGTPVIRGFNFNFSSGDRHIKEIGVVMNGNSRLTVFYGDKTPTDPFSWTVRYGILRP